MVSVRSGSAEPAKSPRPVRARRGRRSGARTRGRDGARRPRRASQPGRRSGRGRHQAPVVAEVHRQQLRVAIEAEAADHEPIEVPGEEIGQVERARLLVGQRGEGRPAGVDLVAVRALEPGDALGLEHAIEQPTGSAIRIGDEDPVVAVGARPPDASRGRPRGCAPAGCGAIAGRHVRSIAGRPARRVSSTSSARQRPTSDDEWAP